MKDPGILQKQDSEGNDIFVVIDASKKPAEKLATFPTMEEAEVYLDSLS